MGGSDSMRANVMEQTKEKGSGPGIIFFEHDYITYSHILDTMVPYWSQTCDAEWLVSYVELHNIPECKTGGRDNRSIVL